MKKLTAKQQLFVAEYLKDLNAAAAARRAGYSPNRADAMGHENLRKPEIAEAISQSKTQRMERVQLDADWVLKRLAQDATADLADLYDDAGSLKPVKEWPMAWRTGLVSGVETVQERDGEDADGVPQFVTVRKVKLLDRTKLVELIGRHIDVGAFKDKLEVDATVVGLAERMRRQRGGA